MFLLGRIVLLCFVLCAWLRIAFFLPNGVSRLLFLWCAYVKLMVYDENNSLHCDSFHLQVIPIDICVALELWISATTGIHV